MSPTKMISNIFTTETGSMTARMWAGGMMTEILDKQLANSSVVCSICDPDHPGFRAAVQLKFVIWFKTTTTCTFLCTVHKPCFSSLAFCWFITNFSINKELFIDWWLLLFCTVTLKMCVSHCVKTKDSDCTVLEEVCHYVCCVSAGFTQSSGL